jgi:S-adenosylmethionine/arginine decarboxylase-like enzyme
MLDHKHLIVNAIVNKPPVDPRATEDFLRNVVDKIGMKIKIGPFADYCTADGNNGITGAVCIETSHLSIHAWDKAEPPYLRFDLYSCATFEVKDVIDMIKQTFDAVELHFTLLDRNETKIKVLND